MAEYMQFTRVALVDTLVRLKNSKNGNPRYFIAFADGLSGNTKSDAGFVYGIHSGLSYVRVSYHFTPKGNCIIDDIAEE